MASITIYCLLHYDLHVVVDVKQQQLLDSVTRSQVQEIVSHRPSIHFTLLPLSCSNAFEAILKDFPSVIQPFSEHLPVRHDVTHLQARQCMLAHDNWHGSVSNWHVKYAYHPVVAGHPHCTWYQRNLLVTGALVATIVLLTSLPSLIATPFPTSNILQPQVLYMVPQYSAYHQIPIEPADISKTALGIPFGLFKFVRMPLGLRNAAQPFRDSWMRCFTVFSLVPLMWMTF